MSSLFCNRLHFHFFPKNVTLKLLLRQFVKPLAAWIEYFLILVAGSRLDSGNDHGNAGRVDLDFDLLLFPVVHR